MRRLSGAPRSGGALRFPRTVVGHGGHSRLRAKGRRPGGTNSNQLLEFLADLVNLLRELAELCEKLFFLITRRRHSCLGTIRQGQTYSPLGSNIARLMPLDWGRERSRAPAADWPEDTPRDRDSDGTYSAQREDVTRRGRAERRRSPERRRLRLLQDQLQNTLEEARSLRAQIADASDPRRWHPVDTFDGWREIGPSDPENIQ